MVVGLLIRGGILVGSIYYTKKLGIWGSSHETEALYSNIKQNVQPHLQKIEKQLPFELPDLPKRGEIRFITTHYYNEGVKKSFNFIEMIPCNTGQLISKIKKKFEEFSESPKPSK